MALFEAFPLCCVPLCFHSRIKHVSLFHHKFKTTANITTKKEENKLYCGPGKQRVGREGEVNTIDNLMKLVQVEFLLNSHFIRFILRFTLTIENSWRIYWDNKFSYNEIVRRACTICLACLPRKCLKSYNHLNKH